MRESHADKKQNIIFYRRGKNFLVTHPTLYLGKELLLLRFLTCHQRAVSCWHFERRARISFTTLISVLFFFSLLLFGGMVTVTCLFAGNTPLFAERNAIWLRRRIVRQRFLIVVETMSCAFRLFTLFLNEKNFRFKS